VAGGAARLIAVGRVLGLVLAAATSRVIAAMLNVTFFIGSQLTWGSEPTIGPERAADMVYGVAVSRRGRA